MALSYHVLSKLLLIALQKIIHLKTKLSIADEIKVIEAIKEAEQLTSCEIRVHIQQKCEGDSLDVAVEIFAELNMHKTASRNGILIFIALDDHQLAIIGDVGINEKVAANFWEDEKEIIIDYFKRESYGEGLKVAILKMAREINVFFPADENNNNELTDDISYGA